MRLLLDTHVVLWWLAGSKMRDEAVDLVADPDNLVYVSAASIWEISIKSTLGKLDVDGDVLDPIRADFEHLDITWDHANRAGRLPLHHRDPFDRMLIAQGIAEQLTVVTRDPRFGDYEVPVINA